MDTFTTYQHCEEIAEDPDQFENMLQEELNSVNVYFLPGSNISRKEPNYVKHGSISRQAGGRP